MKDKTPKDNKDKKPEFVNITTNHEARRDYFILETLEAGIALQGCEVKSLRESKSSLAGSFAFIEKGEVFLHNMYITPYAKASYDQPEPTRKRKLLLKHSEIERLIGKVQQKGLALIPLKAYFNPRGIAKIELALAKGKKLYDKRSDIKKESTKRDIDRAIKNRNRK